MISNHWNLYVWRACSLNIFFVQTVYVSIYRYTKFNSLYKNNKLQHIICCKNKQYGSTDSTNSYKDSVDTMLELR